MNLLEIRQKFITFSGRYDLATTTISSWDTDNGADFFINAGQRFLDRRFETAKTYGRRFDSVAAGSYYQVFQNCRAISEVWCNDSDERWKLRRYDKQTIRDNYSGLVSGLETGPPL
ncbi:MAG: hypothetical protein KKD77_21660, partial [Gammaproteobacteria bacterium]|nr:hypothetical protein [Gammaproteobacteria bacterium]